MEKMGSSILLPRTNAGRFWSQQTPFSPCFWRLMRGLNPTSGTRESRMKDLPDFMIEWIVRLRLRLKLTSTETWKRDRKSTRLNSSHLVISYAVFCLKKKTLTGTSESSPINLLVALCMSHSIGTREPLHVTTGQRAARLSD